MDVIRSKIIENINKISFFLKNVEETQFVLITNTGIVRLLVEDEKGDAICFTIISIIRG